MLSRRKRASLSRLAARVSLVVALCAEISCSGGGGGGSGDEATPPSGDGASATQDPGGDIGTDGFAEPETNPHTTNTSGPAQNDLQVWPGSEPGNPVASVENQSDNTSEQTASPAITSSPVAQFRRFSWTPPPTRENGQALALTEILGYALVFFTETGSDAQPQMAGRIPSMLQFRAAGGELRQFIDPAEVASMISSGDRGSLVITAPQTSITLELPPGKHHFALSAFDWAYLYSGLSNTVTLDIAR